MFDDAIIQQLIDSVGWDIPLNTALSISAANATTSSRRRFNGFHPLVTSENVFETAGREVLTNDQLNAELYSYKEQAALETINKIFNSSPRFIPSRDYGGTVVNYLGVIVEVYGLVTCVNVLKMFSTSIRTNTTERRVKYGLAKVELDGYTDNNGKKVSFGLEYKLSKAITDAQKAIFPSKYIVDGSNIR